MLLEDPQETVEVHCRFRYISGDVTRIRQNALAETEEVFEVQRAGLGEILAARLKAIEVGLPSKVSLSLAERVTWDRLSTLIDALRDHFYEQDECAKLVELVGNRNVRRSLRAIESIFRLEPKYMDQLVSRQARYGSVRLSFHKVLRALMRTDGRYSSASPECLIPNIFDVPRSQLIPYSLGLRMLRHTFARSAADNPQVA
ncbi:hypothetical protein [Enhygromyxa salina]|uniref:hypothetical protein n=1 Tax=Enhygromyxa salina TaxID=215803 RepID=UPI000D045675|nr:hypothetical protein [Enhygromyxa salina]